MCIRDSDSPAHPTYAKASPMFDSHTLKNECIYVADTHTPDIEYMTKKPDAGSNGGNSTGKIPSAKSPTTTQISNKKDDSDLLKKRKFAQNLSNTSGGKGASTKFIDVEEDVEQLEPEDVKKRKFDDSYVRLSNKTQDVPRDEDANTYISIVDFIMMWFVNSFCISDGYCVKKRRREEYTPPLPNVYCCLCI
eukprot:TRINITY_DN13023_c0_g1_i1.p1 TRINITY_DN13023_c0_g1~~TRINITY_DN13023_c0_g1_i1.p1  ORF type:complete len:212 (-),score=44.76 TRINITY_DN13023_c0_g1_i1:153-728(-)